MPPITLPTVADMQNLADEAGKARLVLLSNERVIKLLEGFYKQTLEDAGLKEEDRTHCEHAFKRFKTELWELGSQHEMHLDHVGGLKDTVDGRKEIVSVHLEDTSWLSLNIKLTKKCLALPAVAEEHQHRAEGAGRSQRQGSHHDAHHHRHHTVLPAPNVHVGMATLEKPVFHIKGRRLT